MQETPDRPIDETVSPSTSRRVPRRCRIDTGGGNGPEIAPGRGSLLRAFGSWGVSKSMSKSRPSASAVKDRRGEVRHSAECLAWVGWKVWRGFKMNDALVINISRGGAQVFLDVVPPDDRPVWLFLETPSDRTIVKARMHGFRTTKGGQCAAHVEFLEVCPYAFFEAAVCGLAASDPKARPAHTGHGVTPPAVARRLSAG